MKATLKTAAIAAAILLSFIQPLSAKVKEKVDSVNMWAIDMTTLKVGEQWYAVWSGWDKYYEEEGSGQFLYIAPMYFHDTKPYVTLGQRTQLSRPELPWELKHSEHIALQEGPAALYHGDDIFILYSTRGSWTRHYKIGELRLKSKDLDPTNPRSWEKKEEPVFTGVEESDGLGYVVRGVGHASYVKSPDGTENWIYFHTKTADQGGWGDRKACLQKFIFDANGDPFFGDPADPAVPMARPSGELQRDTLGAPATFMNPLHKGADPWMTEHDGKYYTCYSGKGGICVTESPFMTKFADGTLNREKNAVRVWKAEGLESGRWNSISVWAPEIHFIDGRWYIFYAAGRQHTAPYWEHRAGVLVSFNGPFGPYVESDDKPLFTGEIIRTPIKKNKKQ